MQEFGNETLRYTARKNDTERRSKTEVAVRVRVWRRLPTRVIGRIKESKTKPEWKCNLSWYATFD